MNTYYRFSLYLVAATLLFAMTGTALADGPPPTITSINPTSVTGNGSGFLLTVFGTNFTVDSTIYVGNLGVATTFIDSSQLTADLSPAPQPGSYAITVVNPSIPGAANPSLINSTATADFPLSLAVSPDGAFIYVVDNVADKLQKFNASDLSLAGEASTDHQPISVAISPDGNFVYVSNLGGATVIQKFNASDLSVVVNGTNGSSSAYYHIAVSPDGNSIYAIDNYHTLSKFSAADLSLTTETILGADSLAAIGVSTDNNYGYVVLNSGSNHALYKFDTSDLSYVAGATIADNDPAANIVPIDLAVSPDGNYVYVTNGTNQGGKIHKFRTSDLTETIIYGAEIGPNAGHIVISHDGAYIYNVGYYGLEKFDAALNRITDPVRTDIVPSDVDISPDGNNVYVISYGSVGITNTLQKFNSALPPNINETSNAKTLTVGNPVPVIDSIDPTSAMADDPPFTLTVTGSNFMSQSVIYFGNLAVQTSFDPEFPNQLTTFVSPVPQPGSYAITVVNPAPGGGTSNAINFIVHNLSGTGPTITNQSLLDDYCPVVNGNGVAYFSWTYDNTFGYNEAQFELQVDNNSDFSSPVIDRTFSNLSNAPGTVNQQSVSLMQNAQNNTLQYGSYYYWQVRVWDNAGLDSDWIQSGGYGAPAHPGPDVDFSFTPIFPLANNPVYFTNLSTCFDSQGSAACSYYSWDFGDGSYDSTENPQHSYAASGSYPVVLQVYDDLGSCMATHNINVANTPDNSVPLWREVSPFK